jgi:hypothetical protein
MEKRKIGIIHKAAQKARINAYCVMKEIMKLSKVLTLNLFS